ncbi:uncharacterized protein BDR25DRAFT_239412 [Lindgomyces ingoldianus]|uniref:Uncharacterized protein n=1 Tax=Lindgomyces ingoldianus TaxID=673940 RepID=A0ACB6QHF9_9PLEO|nr:uncharacterized protein BDR25DRAFT_239412 [Lindgomyces ingoldianus]KAF2465547.1 hypothetical protein BDR25DRAFT_239412 [Lindgomyces ingoldianus]
MQLSDGSDHDASPATLVHREFKCMNDEYSECRTGQYTISLSRKVISNHFGRNKACTRQITNWPLFCRKHYQRATYKPDLWQKRKIFLINRQLDLIEAAYPGTKYDIALKKSEDQRLNLFSRNLAGGMNLEVAKTLSAQKDDGKAFEAPITVLHELGFELGHGKVLREVKNVVAIILDMLRNGETKEVPAIEFLPIFTRSVSPPATPPVPPTTPTKPKSAAKKRPASSSRVSAKGAIKKTKKQ